MDASTTDRQADVHILCIDDVVARASDMAAVSGYRRRKKKEKRSSNAKALYNLPTGSTCLVKRIIVW